MKQLVSNALTMLCRACMLGYVAMLGGMRPIVVLLVVSEW